MDRKENLDFLIRKMADPALMKKLSLTYEKKRSFKYKDKANIHHSGNFNETEECLKLLGFLGKDSVNNPNHKQKSVHKNLKEFSSEKDIKNLIHIKKESCRLTDYADKQGGKTHLSRKQRKIKPILSRVVTLSSDSSEDEIQLVQKSTVNEFKAIPSRVVNEKKSCVNGNLSEVSNESVVSTSNKCKDKIMESNTYNSPERERSKRKEQKHSVISNAKIEHSNEKENKKKSAEGKKLCCAYKQKENLLKPGVSKSYFGSAAFIEQDIITISDDSLTDSDENIQEKNNYKGTEEKVQKNESKNVTKDAKFAAVNKLADTSEANAGNKVSLFNPHNLSERDRCRTVKGHTSCEIPSLKNIFYSDQNNQEKNVKRVEKTTPINRNIAQGVSESKTKLKVSGNKAVILAKSGIKPYNSCIRNHSDNLSNASCNSDSSVMSDNSSDEVIFEGLFKTINSNGSNEDINFQKGMPFIKQKNDLENPEKAHTVYDKNVTLSPANSCIRNDKSLSSCNNNNLGEIYTPANFGKGIQVNLDDISKRQRASNELLKMDFVPEPVDFEIPPLHEKENVSQPSEEDIARWEKQGLKRKKGKFTPKEDKILERNFNEFSKEYGISDPCLIFGIHSDKKRDPSISRFLRAKHFYARLGKDLNDRTLQCIYHRARLIFHPYVSNKKWSSEDISKLMQLHKIYGTNWNKIGKILKKSGRSCDSCYYNQQHKNKKLYASEEEKSQIKLLLN